MQEKSKLRNDLEKEEDSITFKQIIEELKIQHDNDIILLQKEQSLSSSLKRKIEELNLEIESLRNSHLVESNKMENNISTLEARLKNESESLKKEKKRNKILIDEIDEEKNSIERLNYEIDNLNQRLKQAKKSIAAEEKHRQEIADCLEEEKERLERCQKKLTTENQNRKNHVILNDRIKDLEDENEFLIQQRTTLEEKFNLNQKKYGELSDILHENEELKQNVILKDRTIEELERQLNNIITNGDVKMRKMMEKLRVEYEMMARSTVNMKMRKMNEYLNERLKQQEHLEVDKESVAKGIQIDLEERLSSTSVELSQIKSRLKSK